MSPEETISDLLFSAVTAAAPDGIDVQFPMIPYSPPNSGKYIETIQIRNNLDSQTWGAEKDYRGVLRLILHWPIDSSGELPAVRTAELIANGFPKGTRLVRDNVSISLYDNADIGSSIPNGKESLIPITVRYSFFYFD